MLNFIWPALVIFSLAVSFFTGNPEEVCIAGIEGAKNGILFTIELCGIMCFWTGLMKIAEKAGLINFLSRLLSPLIKVLFPDVKNQSTKNAIVMNMAANIFGMSNAATPLGLKAMQELDKENHYSKTASNAICMFVLINTASIQLIPSTLIALRAQNSSSAPSEIIVPVWIVSFLSLFIAIIFAKIAEKRSKLF